MPASPARLGSQGRLSEIPEPDAGNKHHRDCDCCHQRRRAEIRFGKDHQTCATDDRHRQQKATSEAVDPAFLFRQVMGQPDNERKLGELRWLDAENAAEAEPPARTADFDSDMRN